MTDLLTVRAAGEAVAHEAIVCEAYKDSKGIWTWGVGLTVNSGVDPLQYKDKPATIEHVLEAYVQRLRKVYVPDVLRAFAKIKLTEAQFAAALSFHFNTGAILKSDWVDFVVEGQPRQARAFLETHYLNDGTLKGRRMDEAALFFDGTWHGNGQASVYPVLKPSYQPDFRHPKRVNIVADLTAALAA